METIPPIVERIVDMLTATQHDIAQTLKEVQQSNERIAVIVQQHTRLLTEHTRMLTEHTAILERIEQRQNGH